jgi:steroid delta-isomerase-like uncharacterized protein
MPTLTEELAGYLRAIDARDRAAVRAAYTDDVEIVAPGVELRGRDAAAGWIDVFIRAFPDLRHELRTATEGGGRVAAEIRFEGTHTGPLASPTGDIPPTGKAVALDYVDVARLVDGRVASEHVYFDQVTFLRQLGLMPG